MCLALLCATGAAAAEPEKERPAKLRVSGYGFLGNRQLKRSLVTLLLEKRKKETYA